MQLAIHTTKKSFSFAEVLVGIGIIAIVFGGLLASFVFARNIMQRSSKRLIAMNLARSVLNELYKEVRADTWDVNGEAFDPNTDPHSVSNCTIDTINYTTQYQVNAYTAPIGYRKVTVTVGYPTE